MTGCNYHARPREDCLYCRNAPEREAARVNWVDKCPHCSSSDIRIYENEAVTYPWCGQCGKQGEKTDVKNVVTEESV